MLTWRKVVLCVCVLCLYPLASCAPRAADEVLRRPANWVATGDEIVALVRKYFYDQGAADAWALKHADYGAAADTEEEFASLTKRTLAELNVSHTAFYTSQEPEYYGLLAIFARGLKVGVVEYDSIGADFTPDQFVRVVFGGGPAAAAGLRRGDKILSANGEAFHPVGAFRGRAGETVTLTVQRWADRPPIDIRVQPRRINPKREWLEAEENGTALLARNGKTIGYVPFFSCAGDEYEAALQELINTKLQAAHALIVDFRDGWGGCDPGLVSTFNNAPPVLTFGRRDGKTRRLDMQWRKPLFVLINGRSRSGKEVVAYAIKKHRLGTLVGQRTAGAVLGGRAFLLSDRSLLYLAVEDVRVDGERLEGRGVDPDVEVADALPFANGDDPQLARALDLAATTR